MSVVKPTKYIGKITWLGGVRSTKGPLWAEPVAQVLALEEQGEHAGLASSLGGTMQMVAAGVLVAAAGPFLDGTVVPMLAMIALCGVLAFGLALVMPRQGAAATEGL